jgi:hypothetical protein
MSRAALCVLFAFAAIPLCAQAADQSAVGEWSGALHHGDSAYRVRFHIQAAPDGRLTGTAWGLPGDDATAVPVWVEKSGEALVIGVAGGRYTGVWDEARAAWVGSWKQADLSEPLALRWEGNNMAPRLAKPIVVPEVTTTKPPAAAAGGGALIIAPPSR